MAIENHSQSLTDTLDTHLFTHPHTAIFIWKYYEWILLPTVPDNQGKCQSALMYSSRGEN